MSNKQIKDFNVNTNPQGTDQYLLQTASGTTLKITQDGLFNETNAALLSLQTQITNTNTEIDNNYSTLVSTSGILQAEIDAMSALVSLSGDVKMSLLVSTSAYLQQEIDNNYSTLVSTSGILQSEINQISLNVLGITGGISQLNDSFVNITGDTMTGKLCLVESTSGYSSLCIPNGVTPNSPNTGDIWMGNDQLFLHDSAGYHQLNYDSNTVGPTELVSITANGDGTINASSIKCFLYSSSTWAGNYQEFSISSVNNLLLTDESINYLIVNYNSGNPIYQITTNSALINNSNICLSATMHRSGTEIHSISVNWGLATAVRENNRSINIKRFERISGLELTETAGRIINISSGVVYYGVRAISEDSSTSAVSGAYFYYHLGGNWTKQLVSTYNNFYYDNGTDLVEMHHNNDYAVNWIYRFIDGDALPDVAYILGSDHYEKLADAIAAPVPSPPIILSRMAILVGRIVVQKNAATATQIDSAFTQVFTGSSVIDHNDLGGIQGGTIGEYYHLTSSQYSAISGAKHSVTISTNSEEIPKIISISGENNVYNFTRDGYGKWSSITDGINTWVISRSNNGRKVVSII